MIQQAWVLSQFGWVVCPFIPHALPSLWLLLDPLEVSQGELIEALVPGHGAGPSREGLSRGLR